METTSSSISAIALMKWLFPSLIGSTFAVWYKKSDIDWQTKSVFEKVTTSLLGLVLIFIGVVISYYLGNAIIETQNVESFYWQSLIFISCGLSSLKILDAFSKNIDPILETITKGARDLVKGIVNSIVNRWK